MNFYFMIELFFIFKCEGLDFSELFSVFFMLLLDFILTFLFEFLEFECKVFVVMVLFFMGLVGEMFVLVMFCTVMMFMDKDLEVGVGVGFILS